MNTYIDEKVKEHDAAINKLIDITNQLDKNQTKIETILDRFMKTSDDLSDTMKDVSKTMLEIQSNLRDTQYDLQNTQCKVDTLNKKLDNLDRKVEKENEVNHIDIREPIRNNFMSKFSDVGKIGVGAIGAYGIYEILQQILEKINK